MCKVIFCCTKTCVILIYYLEHFSGAKNSFQKMWFQINLSMSDAFFGLVCCMLHNGRVEYHSV
jgi:hypothetical protein